MQTHRQAHQEFSLEHLIDCVSEEGGLGKGRSSTQPGYWRVDCNAHVCFIIQDKFLQKAELGPLLTEGCVTLKMWSANERVHFWSFTKILCRCSCVSIMLFFFSNHLPLHWKPTQLIQWTHQWHFSIKNTERYQRITECFGFEGTLKMIQFQSPAKGKDTFH